MKKSKLIIKSIFVLFTISIVSFLASSIQIEEASAAVDCRCTILNPTKGCYADASGDQCASEGHDKCWEYHENCKGGASS